MTWFCYAERPELFGLHSVRRGLDAHDLRWTVDTPDDLEMVRTLYERLGLAERIVPVADVIAFVRAHPEIAAINGHIEQKDPTA